MLGSPALRPIQWSEWAGEVEQEEGRNKMGRGTVGMREGEAVVNPFGVLEVRPGFVDVRVSRSVERGGLLG